MHVVTTIAATATTTTMIFDNSQTSGETDKSSSSSTVPIAAGTAGGCTLLLFIAAVILYKRRRGYLSGAKVSFSDNGMQTNEQFQPDVATTYPPMVELTGRHWISSQGLDFETGNYDAGKPPQESFHCDVNSAPYSRDERENGLDLGPIYAVPLEDDFADNAPQDPEFSYSVHSAYDSVDNAQQTNRHHGQSQHDLESCERLYDLACSSSKGSILVQHCFAKNSSSTSLVGVALYDLAAGNNSRRHCVNVSKDGAEQDTIRTQKLLSDETAGDAETDVDTIQIPDEFQVSDKPHRWDSDTYTIRTSPEVCWDPRVYKNASAENTSSSLTSCGSWNSSVYEASGKNGWDPTIYDAMKENNLNRQLVYGNSRGATLWHQAHA